MKNSRKICLAGMFIAASLPLSVLAMSSGVAPYATPHRYSKVATTIPVSSFEGFYVGAGISGVMYKANYSTNIGSMGPPATGAFVNGGLHTLGFDLQGGYGRTKNQLYYGVLALLRFHPTKENYQIKSDGFKLGNVSNDWSFALAFKGGYIIHPNTMAYVLLGITHTKMTVKSYDQLNTKYSTSDGRTGIMPGFGMETKVNENLILYSQYTYSRYRNYKHTFPGNRYDRLGLRRGIVNAGLEYQVV